MSEDQKICFQNYKQHMVYLDRLQQEWDSKYELQSVSQIVKTHSVSSQERAKLTPQTVAWTVMQDRLQRKRDGNDQVHTKTSFADNQTHVAK